MGIGTLAQPAEDHRCRGEAEGDDIGQGVQFLADGRTDLQGTGREAVKEVEHCAGNDKHEGKQVHALECIHGSNTTREEIAAGDSVRNMAAHRRSVYTISILQSLFGYQWSFAPW